MLLIPNAIGCNGGMMARGGIRLKVNKAIFNDMTYLTCSEMSCVVPISGSSSHLPKKSSPRKGLSGFFSLPPFSFRLAYDGFRVLRYHFSTSRERFCGSGSFAGATSKSGRSAQ